LDVDHYKLQKYRSPDGITESFIRDRRDSSVCQCN